LVLVVAQYVVVLGFCAAVGTEPWGGWTEGSLTRIVVDSCGTNVGLLILIASLLGMGGLFIMEVMEDSAQLECLVHSGMLPAATGFGWQHPKFKTAWGAIAPSVLFCLVCCFFSFSQVLLVSEGMLV
jgi:hypothetical protein